MNLSSVKTRFDRTLHAIVSKHRRDASGVQTALALTRRLDSLVQSVYAQTGNPQKKNLALVALGGYGRRELCFASDTDIMFLVKDDPKKETTEAALKELLHSLLDCGLQVGHSFRTVGECIELAGADFDSWNSLLESRFLCGSRALFVEFHSALKRHISGGSQKVFVERTLHSIRLRHEKYGTSTKLLEPNVKNSAGGLRDLHTLLWLLRGTGSVPLSRPSQSIALSSLLQSSALKKIVNAESLAETRKALRFLLRVRNEMHLQARGLHDTLEFASQRRVAEALHIKEVERFMQKYHVAARAVARLTERVAGWAQEIFLAAPHRRTVKQVHPKFCLVNGSLDLSTRNGVLSSADLLTAALLCIEHNAQFSNAFEDRLHRYQRSLHPLRSVREAELFCRLMNSTGGLGRTLHRLNDLGLLGRLIPEWQPMVAFFQHNVYHYYTADEHTLIAIANAEALADSHSEVGNVFRALPRRDTLYFACLFHDIAKPVSAGDHERRGVTIAGKILERLGAREIQDDVLFLIEHHLIMEQVAFRRNLSDPQTILDFAAKFRHPAQLEYLYVLTYADLSAVNKNVWTDWKGLLLAELYRKTHDFLTGALTPEQLEEAAAQQRSAAKESIVRSLSGTVAPAEMRIHLDAVDSPAYLSAFSTEEIVQHIRTIQSRELTSALFKHQKDYTEVTVIAQDAPFVLSKFCGVLTANDANILDANIFTRSDGIIIDKFRVADFAQKSSLTDDQCAKIRQELGDVYRGRTDIEHLLHRHRMKWKRRTLHRNPNARVDVEFENHPRFTIIDVYAFDMLGFLYKITGALSQLGLNIAFAKIATRADGIVDAFYVTDLTGSKLDDPERREYVKTELLATVLKLAESELVMT